MADPRIIDELGPVHLIGIGGAGMSALAKVLIGRGVRVSGSDLKDPPGLAALRALGAAISIGHDASNLGDARAVVVSSAIRAVNPELRAAREQGLPVYHRAQVLSMLMRERRGIAIAGTHGKTTTTSMIALAMQHAGLDPTFLVGGDLNERGTNAHAGTGEWLVAEADESDGSFLWLAPEIAVITNVEAEHLDHYRDMAEIVETFATFAAGVSADGAVVVCADDRDATAVARRSGRDVITYGLAAGSLLGERVAVDRGGQTVRVSRDGEPLGELRLAVPGEHNARNALAALAVTLRVGAGFDHVAGALAAFQGVQRRFQLRGTAAGVTVVDDYAHHPTEVRAALGSARERFAGRVLAIFQPHLYSRTARLGAELGAALAEADHAVVTDVYGAREDPEPGITGKLVVDGLLAREPRRAVAYLPRRGDVASYVAERARPGDVVLTIGAGDVTMLGEEILRRLEGRP